MNLFYNINKFVLHHAGQIVFIRGLVDGLQDMAILIISGPSSTSNLSKLPTILSYLYP
jgi:hypothetical protein